MPAPVPEGAGAAPHTSGSPCAHPTSTAGSEAAPLPPAAAYTARAKASVVAFQVQPSLFYGGRSSGRASKHLPGTCETCRGTGTCHCPFEHRGVLPGQHTARELLQAACRGACGLEGWQASTGVPAHCPANRSLLTLRACRQIREHRTFTNQGTGAD